MASEVCQWCSNTSSAIDSLEDQVEQLQKERDQLKQEAQIHAQEARTQKSIVHEIYQALGIQKGDWNGAVPVAELFDQLKKENERLKQDIQAWNDDCLV